MERPPGAMEGDMGEALPGPGVEQGEPQSAPQDSMKVLPGDVASEMFEEELAVPLGRILQGLKQVELDTAWKHCALYFIFVFLFVFTTMLTNPVWMRFEIQNGMLQNLGVMTNPQRVRSKMDFHAIGTYQEFWTWAEHTLIPGIYSSNATRLSGNVEAYSYAIARYNMLITPVRFRQVRVQHADCSVPVESQTLSRPCWPTYGNDVADPGMRPGNAISILGSSYVAEGLSKLSGTIVYGHSYGEGGHVVDLELNADTALAKLRSMISERWTDEWTRAVSVDINVYNPNYDMATALRFSVERLLGGQLVPHLEAYSCPLTPYSGALGIVRAIFEVIWIIMYVAYLVITFLRWWRRGFLAWFSDFRNYVDVVYILCFLASVILWIAYLTQDLAVFKERQPTKFQDLYSACKTLEPASNFAAFAVVVAFVHFFAYVSRLPRFELFRQVFLQSMNLVLSFVVILILGVVAFTFSSLWLFGNRVSRLHVWWQAFGLLVHGLAAGFERRHDKVERLFQQIREVNPVIGSVWIVAWVFMMVLTVVQFAIIIAVDKVAAAKRLAAKLEQVFEEYPLPRVVIFLKSKCRCCVKDIDTLEPIHNFRKSLRMWKMLLAHIDLEHLQTILYMRLGEGADTFKVDDAIKLFPHRSVVERRRRATDWMKHMMGTLRASLPQASQRESTALEVQLLTHKMCRLEEEVFGLSLQLSKLLPETTAARLMPQMI